MVIHSHTYLGSWIYTRAFSPTRMVARARLRPDSLGCDATLIRSKEDRKGVILNKEE